MQSASQTRRRRAEPPHSRRPTDMSCVGGQWWRNMRAHTVSEDVTDRKGHSDCCRRSCSRAAEQCEHAEPAKQKRRHAQASSSHFVLPSCTSLSVGVTSCMSSSGRGKLTGTRCSVSSSESAAHTVRAPHQSPVSCHVVRMDGGVALQEERDGALVKAKACTSGGSADEVVLEAQKGFGGTKCHGGRLPGRDARCHGGRP